MKRTISFILSILLILGICDGMVALIKGIHPDDSSTGTSSSAEASFSKSDSSSGAPSHSDSSDSSATMPSETEDELTDPTNKSELVQGGITMVTGASVYLGDDGSGPSIRFTFNVSADLKAEVENDEKKTFYYLIAPVYYFDDVNTENSTYVDWVTEFKKANRTVIYNEYSTTGAVLDDDTYKMTVRLTNMLYKNTNLKFVCMMVVETKTGDETSYRYNGYESGVNYRNNARSLAYLSSVALNAHALGLETFDETALTKLKSYVNRSVDYANGLEEATEDNSTYDFQIKALMHENMQVGEKFTIAVTITPDVEVPVWYRSTNQDVAIVDDNGVVTITGKGTTVIGVYVAGQVKGVMVTIE